MGMKYILSIYKGNTYGNTYPTSNAKSLAYDTANEHALQIKKKTYITELTLLVELNSENNIEQNKISFMH